MYILLCDFLRSNDTRSDESDKMCVDLSGFEVNNNRRSIDSEQNVQSQLCNITNTTQYLYRRITMELPRPFCQTTRSACLVAWCVRRASCAQAPATWPVPTAAPSTSAVYSSFVWKYVFVCILLFFPNAAVRFACFVHDYLSRSAN